jgi:N-acetylglutamate synthase-like GNAT family acetyltransferase
MVEVITYRRASEADILVLAGHHRSMFEEMRSREGLSLQATCCGPDYSSSLPDMLEKRPMDFERLEQAHRAKLERQLPDGTCIAWIAENRGAPVGSGALSILETVSVPEDPSFTIGFIHSIYVQPSMRRRGIASALIDRLLDHCRKIDITRVQLNASKKGKDVYAKRGFKSLDQVMIRWL